MKYKLKMDREQVIDAIKKSITKACKYTDDVEWSPEMLQELKKISYSSN